MVYQPPEYRCLGCGAKYLRLDEAKECERRDLEIIMREVPHAPRLKNIRSHRLLPAVDQRVST